MFSGSIVALVTPFKTDNSIDYNILAQLIEWHINSGTSGIVLAGTTGESATLSSDEKIALAQAAVKFGRGRIKLLAGNGSNNTAASVELTKCLNNTGIDGYLTVTPYYNKPTDAGLIAHYKAIAAASTLPIILYNVPSRTGCDLSNEIIVQLAELNNIIGIKDATADLTRVSPLKKQLSAGNITNFILLSGDDASAIEYCEAGGRGIISVTANVAPQEIAEIQRFVQTEDIKKARVINDRLADLHQALFIESNPIPVKWALFWLMKLTNENLRLPLLSLSKSAQVTLTQTLKNSGIKQYPLES